MSDTKVRDAHGREIDFDVVARLMDAALFEKLRASGAYPNKQNFFEAYAQAHARKYSQSFAPYTGGRW